MSIVLVQVFLQQNHLDALISQIYFWNKTLHVSDSSSVHHHQFFTVHTAMVDVSNTCMYCCVYSEKLLMMDKGTIGTNGLKAGKVPDFAWTMKKKSSPKA